MICDLKGGGGEPWRLDSTPSSPCPSSSLGSRKSSVCSVASLNSCGSTGTASAASAASGASAAASAASAGSQAAPRPRSFSQAAPPPAGAQPPLRLASVVSRDSGFTSQDTLFVRPSTPSAAETPEEEEPAAPAPAAPAAAAPAPAPAVERPHTISSGGTEMLAGMSGVPPRIGRHLGVWL